MYPVTVAGLARPRQLRVWRLVALEEASKVGSRGDALLVGGAPAWQDLFKPPHFLQMADIAEASRTSSLELQRQLGEYKEKNRRELAEMQTQLKEKSLEVEKARLAAGKMQDEVMPAG